MDEEKQVRGDEEVTVGELKALMRQFVKERDWEKYHTPRNLAASVAVEAGELLELFQWLTAEEAIDKSLNDQVFRRAVGEELSDVLMYLMSLANVMGLEVGETVRKKMIKNKLKYPSDKFKGHYERPISGS